MSFVFGKITKLDFKHKSLKKGYTETDIITFVFRFPQLSNLGIMTARLLPALQECFKSEYVSVRIEAAMVSEAATWLGRTVLY